MSDVVRELLPTATGARTRRAAVELLARHRWLTLLTVAVFAGGAAAGLVAPFALGRIVDAVTERQGSGAVTAAAAVLLAGALAQAALGAAGDALSAQVGESALARLRERVIARAFALPAQRIEEAGAGDLAARIGDDSSLVAAALRNVLPKVTSASLTIVFTLLGLTALDWRFAVAGLCAVPVQAATLRWYLRTSTPLYAAQRVAGGERSRQILESVSGAPAVRAFRLSREHTGRVAERSSQSVDYAVRAAVLRSRFFGRLNVAEYVGLALILVAGYALVHTGAARVGEATAAALMFTRLFDPVNVLLALAGTAQEAAAGLARLVGAADLAPATGADAAPGAEGARGAVSADGPGSAVGAVGAEGPAATGAAAGPADAQAAAATPGAPGKPPAVLARGITHDYRPGHPVLRGVDLRIAPGEQVTLVGPSGAGKSTLARIVAGVHPPTGGAVEIEPGAGAEHASAVSEGPTVLLLDQDTHVFAGTLAENLLLARPGAPASALRAALDRAGALAWAEALPEGLETVVGSGGAGLTAVQAQQLALARLVLADPPVAVLDEAAAEAGSAGARQLAAAAREVLRGRTSLVVAHLLDQAVTADRVVVLEGGRIAEEGTPDELAASGGRYAALWAAWSSRGAPAPALPEQRAAGQAEPGAGAAPPGA
ncbi:ABC transporter ATP-binding protein [Streptomyces sp. NPDC047002]|uniref:ABC transporter ATP-binding protein n=1 Tax=Streptomyces sp. NPDC047002 TaxID=3155475 RepID=UPI00345735F0